MCRRCGNYGKGNSLYSGFRGGSGTSVLFVLFRFCFERLGAERPLLSGRPRLPEVLVAVASEKWSTLVRLRHERNMSFRAESVQLPLAFFWTYLYGTPRIFGFGILGFSGSVDNN